LININLDEKGKKLLDELDEDLEFEDLNTTQKIKAKRTRIEAVVGATKRLKMLAKDIINHFENRQKVFLGKGMIVTMSREIAVNLYEQIIKFCPEWHDQDLEKGQIKVVMTANASDGPKMAKHHTNKSERELLAKRLKDPHDNLNLVIVCDMWLTGFDAPCLHTLYIDKQMKGHNLMQAIARINRVYIDKPGGLVVDYLGIGNELKEAMAFYAESGGKGTAIFQQQDAINLMLEKFKIVEELLLGCDYEDYFTTDTRNKLDIILQTAEHILKLENGKEKFNQEVTALSQAFALSIPSPEAMKINEKISFFQAVQSRLKKFDFTDSELTNYEIETTIKQVVDQAIISDQIIDIFELVGIKKPNVSILSDEFLLEVKSMKHQNLAIELLKKLLNDKIKTINKTNIVLSKNLLEMLENTLGKYQKKLLTGLEIIEELINIAKEIKAADQRGEELGLTDYELAFYDALGSNNNAREIMGIEKLRDLTRVLVKRVRENVSIDWNIREDAKARIKIMVKRLLRQYGYPPDMEKLATELVLEQASYLW
ncbi:MAG TPA: type I restriction enzyme endonuclease domain-containing protein, partial [Allocoleopsis sp.]